MEIGKTEHQPPADNSIIYYRNLPLTYMYGDVYVITFFISVRYLRELSVYFYKICSSKCCFKSCDVTKILMNIRTVYEHVV
jgi:hypothetical protein